MSDSSNDYENISVLKNKESLSCDILTQATGKGVRIIWYFTQNLFQEDVSTNPITFIRREIDVIVLPSFPDVVKTWKWAKSVFNYSDNQAYFYDPFENNKEEKNMLENLISFLKKTGLVNGYSDFQFLPFCTNLVLNEVAELHGIGILNDNLWALPDKSWLHKNIPGSNLPDPEEIFGIKFAEDVKVPKGYVIHSFEELHLAKKILEEQGVKKFVIKNVVGLGGYNIWPIRNQSEFDVALKEMSFPKNLLGYTRPPKYIIEELYDFSVGEKDTCYTPVVHYLGQMLIPGVYYQYCPVFSYSGMNSQTPPLNIQNECLRQSEIIRNTLNFKGPWGIDFVLDSEDNCYIIDINFGRICGSHYFRFFVSLYADGKQFDSWTHPTNPEITSFYDKMTELGINFDFDKKRGIMLIRVLDPKKLSVLCIGDDFDDLANLKNIFLSNFLG